MDHACHGSPLCSPPVNAELEAELYRGLALSRLDPSSEPGSIAVLRLEFRDEDVFPVGEALTGERIGQPLSRENTLILGADVVPVTEGNTDGRDNASAQTARRGFRHSHVRTLFASARRIEGRFSWRPSSFRASKLHDNPTYVVGHERFCEGLRAR